MRSELGIGLLLACACLGACAGEAAASNKGTGGTTSETGGTTSETGGTTSETGGVGGAVPPTAEVGLSLDLSQTARCPILPGVPDDIGDPPPDSVHSGAKGGRRADGDNGVSVSCSVTARSGDSYLVEASISSADPRLAVSITGSVDDDRVGTAIIALTARALPADVMSPADTPCTLTVLANGALEPGAIWARFNCATLVAPPTYDCAATGELVLENCAK
jgi:hypothetical protein